MDGFTYNDIFETKGIEYLIIIGFFAILIPFWLFLTRRVRIAEKVRNAIGALTLRTLKIPQGIYYSGNHTWAHLGKTGEATIGIDDLLLHITGEVNFNNLRKPGDRISKNETLGEIEHEGNILKILSPVSGEIIDTNPALTSDPGIIAEDPYQNGWMYRMKPEKWVSETSTYRLAGDATKWFEDELARLKDFLARHSMNLSPETSKVVLQDGGEITEHILAELPQEVWNKFQDDFLSRTDIEK